MCEEKATLWSTYFFKVYYESENSFCQSALVLGEYLVFKLLV